MIIKVDSSFKKDFKKLKNKSIESRIIEKIDELDNLDSLDGLSNVKHMKGFNNFYRIRLGNYRIGFKIEGDILILLRVRSRKDIYNIFP